jgi:hypothetical protein
MNAPAAHADRPAFDFKEAKAALTSSSTTGRTAQLRSVEEKLTHKSESPVLGPPPSPPPHD